MKLNKKRLIIGVGIIVILILLMAIPLGNGDRRKNEEEKSEVTEEFDAQKEVTDDDMELVEKLKKDMIDAIKNKEKERLTVIRME